MKAETAAVACSLMFWALLTFAVLRGDGETPKKNDRAGDNFVKIASIAVGSDKIFFPVFRRVPEEEYLPGQLMALAGIDAVFIFSVDRWRPLRAASHFTPTP